MSFFIFVLYFTPTSWLLNVNSQAAFTSFAERPGLLTARNVTMLTAKMDLVPSDVKARYCIVNFIVNFIIQIA